MIKAEGGLEICCKTSERFTRTAAGSNLMNYQRNATIGTADERGFTPLEVSTQNICGHRRSAAATGFPSARSATLDAQAGPDISGHFRTIRNPILSARRRRPTQISRLD
jgi:hypothetical protein